MKRGTPRHPKVEELAIRLGKPKYAAVGLLEMLWHFASEFAHAGDIGRFSDESISKALCWDGDSSMLVSCLVDTGWVDKCDCHRLRIHDWPDHADQTVQRILSNRNQQFASCYDETRMKLASAKKKLCSLKPKANTNTKSQEPIPQVASLPRFQKPSVEMLKEECLKIGLPESEAGAFFDWYEANGWKVGKARNPMSSWRGALSTWKRRIKSEVETIPQQKSLLNLTPQERKQMAIEAAL